MPVPGARHLAAERHDVAWIGEQLFPVLKESAIRAMIGFINGIKG